MKKQINTIFEFLTKMSASIGAVLIGLIASIVAAGLTDIGYNFNVKEKETFKIQVEKLNEAEESIKALAEFIESQKARIFASEKLLEKLKTEKEKLEPFVNMKKEEILSVLEFHEEKNKNNKYIDIFISFTIGVLSSISATYLYSRKKRKESGQKIENA